MSVGIHGSGNGGRVRAATRTLTMRLGELSKEDGFVGDEFTHDRASPGVNFQKRSFGSRTVLSEEVKITEIDDLMKVEREEEVRLNARLGECLQ